MKRFFLWQRPTRPGSNHGFSLIELMIVLTLVALFASLTFTYSTLLQRLLVKSEVEKLAAAFQYMQQLARVRGAEQAITFDLNKQEYSYQKEAHCLPRGVQFGTIAHLLGPPSSPIHGVEKAVTFDGDRVVCFPDGAISSGSVYVTDRNKRYQFAVTTPIADVSYVRTYEYTGQWKLLS